MERWFFQRRAEIAIRLWRMPGKEEINHLAHRDLIGLRGKVKASLGSASRRDESAPDEQLQDFGVSAFETRIRSAISCDCIPFPDSARQQSAFSADCNRFGKPGQTTGFAPFGVDCPKCAQCRQWAGAQNHVIGITLERVN